MHLLNKKGFLLVDSLINVVIVSSLCLLCFVSYKAIDNYYKGYDNYIEESNNRYTYIFNSIGECQRCVVTKEDSLRQEP